MPTNKISVKTDNQCKWKRKCVSKSSKFCEMINEIAKKLPSYPFVITYKQKTSCDSWVNTMKITQHTMSPHSMHTNRPIPSLYFKLTGKKNTTFTIVKYKITYNIPLFPLHPSVSSDFFFLLLFSYSHFIKAWKRNVKFLTFIHYKFIRI